MQKINSQSGNKSTLSEFALGLILAGHGPPTTLAEVARFREMLVELRAAVDCTIKAGASEAAAMQEVTLPQYAHVQRYKKWMPLDVRAAYRYLRGVWGIPKFSEPTTVAGRPLICDWWQSGATTHGTYPTLAARVATSRSCQNRTLCSAAKGHSITSSAIASNPDGISIPRARAVCKLMVNSNLVVCCTGISAGLVPCRTLPV